MLTSRAARLLVLLSAVALCGSAQAQNLAFLGTHTLEARWELEDSLRNGTFLITPYRPVYVMPAVWSSSPNYSPQRTTEAVSPLPAPIPLNDVECKFQLSLKTKVVQGLFNDKGDVWVAYTQSSRWQLYNTDLSRAFRETNYEPEAFVAYPTKYRFLGFNGKFLALGLNHQSNGRGEPLSRSWNRIVAQVGLERGRCTLLLRPWLRIKEDESVDENPEINNYVGNGEFVLVYQHRSHVVSVQLRNSFITDPFVGGSIQGDWSFTLSGNLKAHLQVFHGYGESMLDYNHLQSTVGIGISLLEWL